MASRTQFRSWLRSTEILVKKPQSELRYFPLKDLFRAALVVHVDLSVAVWFMAFAAVIWCSVGGGGLAWLAGAVSAWPRWGPC